MKWVNICDNYNFFSYKIQCSSTHEGAQGLEDSDGAPTPTGPAPVKTVPKALAPLPGKWEQLCVSPH